MDLDEDSTANIEKYVATKRTYPFEDFPSYIIRFNPHRQRHIMSFGIIAYCVETDKYLLVQRRYSPNYLTLLRGAYRRSNLPQLVKGMCNNEFKILRRVIYRQLNIHELLTIVCPGGDHDYSAMRFDNHENLILQLINKAQCDRDILDEPEWLFPKGRPDKHENGLDAALREFREETGISPGRIRPINQWPIVDHYKADNDFIYETRYWILVFDTEPPIPTKFQSYEVSARGWKTKDEVEEAIKATQCNIFHEAASQLSKTDMVNRMVAE